MHVECDLFSSDNRFHAHNTGGQKELLLFRAVLPRLNNFIKKKRLQPRDICNDLDHVFADN